MSQAADLPDQRLAAVDGSTETKSWSKIPSTKPSTGCAHCHRLADWSSARDTTFSAFPHARTLWSTCQLGNILRPLRALSSQLAWLDAGCRPHPSPFASSCQVASLVWVQEALFFCNACMGCDREPSPERRHSRGMLGLLVARYKALHGIGFNARASRPSTSSCMEEAKHLRACIEKRAPSRCVVCSDP